jgi:hypothetical protein
VCEDQGCQTAGCSESRERGRTVSTTMDKRPKQSILVTNEAQCFVRSVVPLTSSGLLACRIFGPSRNARIADTAVPSLSEMATQRNSGRIMRKGLRKSEARRCLTPQVSGFLFCYSVSGLQVFFISSKQLPQLCGGTT